MTVSKLLDMICLDAEIIITNDDPKNESGALYAGRVEDIGEIENPMYHYIMTMPVETIGTDIFKDIETKWKEVTPWNR